MFAGLLNERIELYEQVKVKNAFGEEEENLELRFRTKAKVSHAGGSKAVINNEIQTPYDKTFVVREYVPVLDTTWIKYRDKYWRVTSIDYDRALRQKIVMTQIVNE